LVCNFQDFSSEARYTEPKEFAMRLMIVAFALASLGAVGPSVPLSQTPVAVELFTSQGCSSCPPADALIARLVREPNTVILTRPVTYWDRLGWKDTLAREENTQLQRSYAARGGAGSGVYTPQAMVQGTAGIVGSDELGLRRLINAEKRVAGPQVSASVTQDGGRSINISQSTSATASVFVVALKSDVVVRIGKGENGGRTVHYANVVLEETQVGRWQGGSATVDVPGKILKQATADRYAVIVRARNAGRILAARYI
jgi:hypothetical protein